MRFVCIFAAIFNGVVLAELSWELVSTGNLSVQASQAHTVSAALVIFMMAGFVASLACAVISLIQWEA